VSREYLLLLLLVLPLVWAIGWAMAFQWMKIRWMVQLEQVRAQTMDLKKVTSQLEALMTEMEKE
jgi:hypothetical protein